MAEPTPEYVEALRQRRKWLEFRTKVARIQAGDPAVEAALHEDWEPVLDWQKEERYRGN